MTPRYKWTPASNPPDSERMVLAWVTEPKSVESRAYWVDWWFDPAYGWENEPSCVVTHWRDVEPPKEQT